jgi:hypothetical protein
MRVGPGREAVFQALAPPRPSLTRRAADFASLAADAAVRHGCAAQASALTAHRLHLSFSPAGTSSALSLTVRGSPLGPLASRAPFVFGHSLPQAPRLSRKRACAFPAVDGSPTLARRTPVPSQPGHPILAVTSGLLVPRTASRSPSHRRTPRGSKCSASQLLRHPAQHRLGSAPA